MTDEAEWSLCSDEHKNDKYLNMYSEGNDNCGEVCVCMCVCRGGDPVYLIVNAFPCESKDKQEKWILILWVWLCNTLQDRLADCETSRRITSAFES